MCSSSRAPQETMFRCGFLWLLTGPAASGAVKTLPLMFCIRGMLLARTTLQTLHNAWRTTKVNFVLSWWRRLERHPWREHPPRQNPARVATARGVQEVRAPLNLSCSTSRMMFLAPVFSGVPAVTVAVPGLAGTTDLISCAMRLRAAGPCAQQLVFGQGSLQALPAVLHSSLPSFLVGTA